MVSSPELLNKYVGESENNLRALFYQAEMDAEQLGSNRYVYVSIMCQHFSHVITAYKIAIHISLHDPSQHLTFCNISV